MLRPGEGLCFDELTCGSFLPRAETSVPFFPPSIIGLGIWIGFPTVAAYPGHAEPRLRLRGIERALERLRREVRRRLGPCRRNAVRRRRHHDRLDLRRRHDRARHRRRRAARQGRRSPTRRPTRIASCAATRRAASSRSMPVAPPKAFNAGSVFKRTSMLLDPAARQGAEDGLRQAGDHGQGNRRSPPPSTCARSRSPIRCCRRCSPRSSTTTSADVLATAYAPAEARLCQGLALREPAQGRHRRQRPLHPADGQGRS